MKKIFAIAWKDAIIRFASKSEFLFFIILPIVFTFLVAGGTPSGNEDPRIGLLVVDEARTSVSQQIITELENSTAIRPEVLTRTEAQNNSMIGGLMRCLSSLQESISPPCKKAQPKWSCFSSRTTSTPLLPSAPS